ncbi:MAG TPA: hypothetical protein VE907_08100 [Gammaproteobacteria bacterium]|nr:hypothetical protein [Gammaproteobacteria bacterium]
MNASTDLTHWTRAWQSYSAAPKAADLRERVARDIRGARIALIGPVLVTVVAGGGTLVTALTRGTPADIALAVGVWTFIAAVWLGSLWIARGTWRPLAATTGAFLDFSVRRCRSVIAGARLGAILYLLGLFGILWWKHYYLSIGVRALLMSWQVVLFGVAITPAVFSALCLLARRKRAELACLLNAKRQLEETLAG